MFGRVISGGFAVIGLVISGCASSPPTQIGASTYYASKTNMAGAFGNPEAVAGHLMADGNQFCMSKGKEFELVTQSTAPARPGASLGGASITFKCVEHAGDVHMRPDHGVLTMEHR